MKFRDDIDIWNTWVTSDTHFGHKNIADLTYRPEDHEQAMIAEWRKAVPDDATVIHLGDLVYSNNSFFKHVVAKELTGARKMLLMGNHDHQRMSFYRDCGFKITRPFKIAVNQFEAKLVAAGPGEDMERLWADLGWHKVSFAHYPWNTEEEGLFPGNHTRIHGHIHNSGYTRDAFVPFLRNHINVSVEQTWLRPVNLGLLLDAYLRGRFPETTPEQLAEAAERKAANLKEKEAGR